MQRGVTAEVPEFGVGYYTLGEAAWLLRATRREVSGWVHGYLGKVKDGKITRKTPAVETSYEQYGVVTFADLIELLHVKEFRAAGIPMKTIRQAALRERANGGQRAFTGRQWATFLKRLIDADAFVDAATGQRVAEFVDRMWTHIDIDEQGFAARWFPLGRDRLIVLDPDRLRGKPTVLGTRIQTDTLYSQYLTSDEDVAKVAYWYDIPLKMVEDAVEFEQQWHEGRPKPSKAA